MRRWVLVWWVLIMLPFSGYGLKVNKKWLYALRKGETFQTNGSIVGKSNNRISSFIIIENQGARYLLRDGATWGQSSGKITFLTNKDSWAWVSKEGRLYQSEGAIYGPYHFALGPYLAPQGNGWIGTAVVGKKLYAVKNGQKVGPFEYMDSLAFNSDGSKWKCRGYKENVEYVIADGKILPAGEDVRNQLMDDSPQAEKLPIVYSSDWRKWAYTYYLENKGYIKNSDGVEFGPYEKVLTPFFHPGNNKIWGFAYQKNRRWHIKVASQEYGPFDNLFNDYFIPLSGNQYALLVLSGWHQFTVVNDQVFGPFWLCDRFSSAGESWAFRCKRGRRRFLMVINGKEYGTYGYTGAVSFSPDGKKWAFKVEKRDGNHTAIFSEDNIYPQPGFSIIKFIYWIRFWDKQHWAVMGKKTNGKFVVQLSNGKEIGEFDQIVSFYGGKEGNYGIEAYRNGKPEIIIDGDIYNGFLLNKIDILGREYLGFFDCTDNVIYMNTISLP